jgi:hypothetical protein
MQAFFVFNDYHFQHAFGDSTFAEVSVMVFTPAGKQRSPSCPRSDLAVAVMV